MCSCEWQLFVPFMAFVQGLLALISGAPEETGQEADAEQEN